MVIKCDGRTEVPGTLTDLVQGLERLTACEIKGPEVNVISILVDC